MTWCGALRGCLAAKFDSCNSLLSSIHTLLVNILWSEWLLQTWFGIVPVNKLVYLMWLLWVLRSFWRFTLHYIYGDRFLALLLRVSWFFHQLEYTQCNTYTLLWSVQLSRIASSHIRSLVYLYLYSVSTWKPLWLLCKSPWKRTIYGGCFVETKLRSQDTVLRKWSKMTCMVNKMCFEFESHSCNLVIENKSAFMKTNYALVCLRCIIVEDTK